MKKSKTYSKICEKCKSQYEAKRDTSRWCDKCRTCKARGCKTTFKTLTNRESEYCRSCDARMNRINTFYTTSVGKSLMQLIKRSGTVEVVPRDLDNMDAFLAIHQTMVKIQPYQDGSKVEKHAFSLCHLSPVKSKDGKSLGILAVHNLVIAPQSVNAKLGNTDHGFRFTISVDGLDPKWKIKKSDGPKKIQNKLYRYFPKLKNWVSNQSLKAYDPNKEYKKSSFTRSRGDYYSVLLDELIRLMNTGKHDVGFLNTIFTNLTTPDRTVIPMDSWSHSEDAIKQVLADHVADHLLRRDSSPVAIEAPTPDQVIPYSGPYSVIPRTVKVA